MMQFKVNSKRLEIPESTKVQLLRKNEIFAFDDIEVERSVSFDIPATAQNNAILGLANDYHCSGASMRAKIAATMEIGVVTRQGYLCVTSYDFQKRTYKAIFLFGQLLGLQALRNASKFSEMGLQTSAYIDSSSTIYRAPDATGQIWAKAKYNAADSDLNGSVSVKMLIDLVNAQRTDLPTITIPQGLEGLRIVKASMNGYEYKQHIKSTINPDGGTQPDATLPANPYNLQEYDATLFETIEEDFPIRVQNPQTTYTEHYKIQGLRVLTPLQITFPSSVGYKWFLQKGANYGGGASEFYGDHYWSQTAPNVQPTISGAKLGGKTIEFAAGDEFYFINIDDFTWTSGGGLSVYGWNFATNNATFPHDFEVTIKGDARIFLRDNMPNFTPIELCKIIAAMTGTVLRYDETSGVFFDDLQSGWNFRNLEDVITRDTMERKFGEYAQRNYVRFDDSENTQPLEVVYTVDNANLQEDNDLQVMPLASGSVGVRMYYEALTIANDKDTIATTDVEGLNPYLQRVSLQKNEVIQAFCDACITLQVTSIQNILEYVAITPRTIFFYDGVLWSWIELQWNEGKAKFTFVKKGTI